MLYLSKKTVLVIALLIISLLGVTYYIATTPTKSLGESLANDLEKKNYRHAPQVGGFN